MQYCSTTSTQKEKPLEDNIYNESEQNNDQTN